MFFPVDDVPERFAAAAFENEIHAELVHASGEESRRVEIQEAPAGCLSGIALGQMHFLRGDENRVARFEGEDFAADEKNPGAVKAVSDFAEVMEMRGDVRRFSARVEIRFVHWKRRIDGDRRQFAVFFDI